MKYETRDEAIKRISTPVTFVNSGQRKLVYKNQVINDTVGILRKVLNYHNGYDIDKIEVKRLNPTNGNEATRFDITFTLLNDEDWKHES